MPTLILLLRGINVGGKNKLPMAELKETLHAFKLHNVQTYIQSGNVVCNAESHSRDLGSRIAEAIEQQYGFRPHVLVLSKEHFDAAVKLNPFPEAEAEPKTLHVFFCAIAPAAPNLEAIEKAKADTERFQLVDDIFYLHATDGVGRSKLAANAERWLGVPVTARNWRTVQKLADLAEKADTTH